MMTKRIFLVIAIVAGISSSGYANEILAFARYQEIVQGETNAPVAIKKARQYLVSLSHDDFMAFVRQVGKQMEYAREDADTGFAMAIFASCYKQGPGKDEPILMTLKQLSEPTLPSSWKMGLLDALKLENRSDLTEAEVEAVIVILCDAGRNKQSSDVFRSFCLGRLGGFLFSQRKILTQKASDLKDAIEKQDLAVLPKRDDVNIREAAKLIAAIRDYRANLQETADEVKDEQIKTNLQKRLLKWEPSPATPIK